MTTLTDTFQFKQESTVSQPQLNKAPKFPWATQPRTSPSSNEIGTPANIAKITNAPDAVYEPFALVFPPSSTIVLI